MANSEGPSASMRQMLETLRLCYPKRPFQIGLDFKPTATDVIISTATKSGTTWVQQICHGLRSKGDMDFEEISLVIPFLEMASSYGYDDLQAPQPFLPRMYKTHFWYPQCPKGAGKYIIIVR